MKYASETSSQGFTLLEVLLALAIAGIALISLQKAQTGQVDIFDKVRYSDMAQWVANNKLTEYQVLNFWPAEDKPIKIETDFGGARWQVETTFEPTLNANLKKVIVSVRLQNSKREHSTINGIIRKPYSLINASSSSN